MTHLVCFGDSITQGSEFTIEKRWTSLLQQQLDECSPGRYRMFNRGIKGDTTTMALDRMAADVLPLLPAILLIEFGFNDADVYGFTHVARNGIDEFKKNLTEFHRIAIVSNSQPVLIINHLIGQVDDEQGNGISFNDNYRPYEQAIRDVAAVVEAPVIDLPAQMKQRQIALDGFLSEDQIHLSEVGNQDYAGMIYQGLTELKLLL